MFDLSRYSNIALILGTMLVLAGTIGSAVRERYATERATGLQRALEREKAERLKIQARLAPRRLLGEQRDTLVHALLNIPHPVVINLTKLGDKEAGAYAEDFILAFESAGVSGQASYVGMMAPPQYGVVVALNANDQKGLAIAAALKRAGIPFTSSVQPLGDVDATILVALKPPT